MKIIDLVERWYEKNPWTTILMAMFFMVISVFFVFKYRYGWSDANILQLISIMVSGILSLGLLIIYEQMVDAQKKQSDLLDEQRKVTQTANTPVVIIGDYSISEDALEVSLSNYSEKPAIELELSLDIDTRGGEGEWFGRKEAVEKIDEDERDVNALEPYEKGTRFEIEPIVSYQESSELIRIAPVSQSISDMKDDGVDTIFFNLVLHWEDIHGDTYSKEILDYDLGLSLEDITETEQFSLEGMIEASSPSLYPSDWTE